MLQCAVFLDPPYGAASNRTPSLYAVDSMTVADDACAWAVEHGRDPMMRIAFCGYDGKHEMPDDWDCVAWRANGGYGNQGGKNANAARERIWFSPNCLGEKQGVLL